jgi:hypothetical protein
MLKNILYIKNYISHHMDMYFKKIIIILTHTCTYCPLFVYIIQKGTALSPALHLMIQLIQAFKQGPAMSPHAVAP